MGQERKVCRVPPGNSVGRVLEAPGRLKGGDVPKAHLDHLLNKTDSLTGSDCIFSFPISISYILDASSTRDVSITVSAQSKEERTVDSVAALPESIYLLGIKGVVVF
jgi:hypothetical protein